MAKDKSETYGALSALASREEKSYGLREFAILIGVSATYLSQVERGELPPPAEQRVIKTAELLGRRSGRAAGAGRPRAIGPRKYHPRKAKGDSRFAPPSEGHDV